MRTGDTIEEPRVVITCRARLTGPHACTRVHSSSRSLSGACLSPFHPPHSITLPPFALPPYYSPLSTCKRRISTRSATDPRSHLLPRQLMDSGLLHSRYHLSKDSTILPGYNAVVDTTTMSGRERGERGSGLWTPMVHAWTEITVGFLFGSPYIGRIREWVKRVISDECCP